MTQHTFDKCRNGCEGFSPRSEPERFGDAVTVFDQCDSQTRGFGGGEIDRRIPAVERIGAGPAQRRQRQLCAVGGGLAGPFGRAANDCGKMPREPQLAENFLAQALRPVRAGCELDSSRIECGKRLAHAGGKGGPADASFVRSSVWNAAIPASESGHGRTALAPRVPQASSQ